MNTRPVQQPQPIPLQTPPGPAGASAVEPLYLQMGETGLYEGTPAFLLIQTRGLAFLTAEIRPKGQEPIKLTLGTNERYVIGPFHKARAFDGRLGPIAPPHIGPASFTLAVISGACWVTAYPGR